MTNLLSKPFVAGAIVFLALAVLWVVLWQVFQPPLSLFPSPSAVLNSLTDMFASGELWDHILASTKRLALGASLGIVTGVLFAIPAGLNRTTARWIEPITMFFSGISGIVWLPLALAWFGIGTAMFTFLIWNAVFFIVFSNSVSGLQQVPRSYMEAMRSMGASRTRVIISVMIPGAFPLIMQGIRVGISFGWRSLIGAELIGASAGLGYLLFSAADFHRTDTILAGVLVIGVLGLVTDRYLLYPIERRTIEKWGMVTTE